MSKKILYIWFKQYDGVLDGGGTENYRMYHLLQSLFGNGNVDSFYMHKKGEKNSLRKYISVFFNFFLSYHNGVNNEKIRSILVISNKYDYIFLSTSLFGVIARELKKVGYKGEIITHFHNVESVYYASVISSFNPIRPLVVNCARENDRMSCIYSDKTIVLNKRDNNVLFKCYGRKANAIIPISLSDVATINIDPRVLTSTKPVCMFLGSNIGPNKEGVLWFINKVLPYVDIDFMIVGKNMNKLKDTNKTLSDILVIGDAPSLSNYFLKADFMVFPIFSGSGMKVKTCESLMYGKNIIGTPEAFEGYDLDCEKVGAKCETAVDFINAIKKFSVNPIPKYNAYSRKIYEDFYSEETIIDLFSSLF